MTSARAVEPRSPQARLIWRMPEGEEQVRLLGTETVRIGRGRDCEISVLDTKISRHHAEIRFDGKDYVAADLGSANGTYVNGSRVQAGCRLKHGDALRLGGVQFRFEQPVEDTPKRATLVVPELSGAPRLEVSSGPQEGAVFSLDKPKMVIGRAGREQRWDIMLSDRAVSRPHAQIERVDEYFVLTDLGSANGTLVNGQAIQEATALKNGDAITAGETQLIFRLGVS